MTLDEIKEAISVKPYYEEPAGVIYNADCLDILPKIPEKSIDLVLTDPPYGVDFRKSGWDKEIPEIAFNLPALFSRVAIIMGTLAMLQFPIPKWIACWARPASSSRSKVGGFSHWSPILLYGDCKMSVDFNSWHAIANSYPPGFGHPSPKPLALMLWLVGELSGEGSFILDPFLGSGTTAVAAKQLGRQFIGIEISEKYCQIAVQRLAQEILI